MVKTVLISTPYRDIYGPIKRASGRYFFLGLGYIAAFLRQKGYQTLILDPEAQGLSHQELTKRLELEQPDIVGISSATPEFHNAIEIARIIKKHTRALVIMGGIHASSLPDYIMENYQEVDMVCIGEGEETMLELCRYLEGGISSPAEIKGIMFREAGGKIIRTPHRPFRKDLDSLPFPARDLVDLRLYRPHSHNIRKGISATMITSRGCPYQCSFCASRLTLGAVFRPHSPEYVIREIKHLVAAHKVNHIVIQDDTFTLNKKRAMEICQAIIRNHIKIEWFCFSQVNTVDEELLSLMKKAGCYAVGFGVESADQGILKNMGKPITVAQSRRAIGLSNKLGFKTQAFFIFGSRGDDKTTINKTINFACRLNPTLAFFNILIPYPGTKIFNDFFGSDLSHIDWSNFVAIGINPAADSQGLTKKELQWYIYKANLKFYLRISQLLRIIKKIRSYEELAEYLKGAWGLLLQVVGWWKGSRSRLYRDKRRVSYAE